MRLLLFIQRILASLIDLIVIYIPIYLLVHILFPGLLLLSNLFPAIIFIIYNVIATNTFDGQTLGKYFAKITVKKGTNSLMADSVREAVKILYFLPLVGILFAIISCLVFIKKGQFLHDIIGQSWVTIYD